MFSQYFSLGSRIKKHYVSAEVLLCLAEGRFIPPIRRENLYGLQYSMLPARRFGISELWRQLNEADKTGKGSMNGSARDHGETVRFGNGSAAPGHFANGALRRRKR
jgi:phosphatidylinositol N-acetylglucosaminyltransferase subunit Q